MNSDDDPDPEDRVKNPTYKDARMKRLRITKQEYVKIVWPFARLLAGLPEQADPGPKKPKRK